MNPNVRIATRILTYALGSFLLTVGADKAFSLELITDWEAYIGPVSSTVFPFAAETIVRIQGCIELFLAVLLLFTSWKRTALALFTVSTVCVMIDLASHRFYILILRDLVMIASVAALFFLLKARSASLP